MTLGVRVRELEGETGPGSHVPIPDLGSVRNTPTSVVEDEAGEPLYRRREEQDPDFDGQREYDRNEHLPEEEQEVRGDSSPGSPPVSPCQCGVGCVHDKTWVRRVDVSGTTPVCHVRRDRCSSQGPAGSPEWNR